MRERCVLALGFAAAILPLVPFPVAALPIAIQSGAVTVPSSNLVSAGLGAIRISGTDGFAFRTSTEQRRTCMSLSGPARLETATCQPGAAIALNQNIFFNDLSLPLHGTPTIEFPSATYQGQAYLPAGGDAINPLAPSVPIHLGPNGATAQLTMTTAPLIAPPLAGSLGSFLTLSTTFTATGFFAYQGLDGVTVVESLSGTGTATLLLQVYLSDPLNNRDLAWMGGPTVFAFDAPPASAPEPGTLFLLGASLAGLGTRVWWRRARK